MLKDFTTNHVKYYVSNSATASDTQGDLTHDPKTVTYTSNEEEKYTDSSNGNFE